MESEGSISAKEVTKMGGYSSDDTDTENYNNPSNVSMAQDQYVLTCSECYKAFPARNFRGQCPEFRMCETCKNNNPEISRYLEKYVYEPMANKTWKPFETRLKRLTRKCNELERDIKEYKRQYCKGCENMKIDSLSDSDSETDSDDLEQPNMVLANPVAEAVKPLLLSSSESSSNLNTSSDSDTSSSSTSSSGSSSSSGTSSSSSSGSSSGSRSGTNSSSSSGSSSSSSSSSSSDSFPSSSNLKGKEGAEDMKKENAKKAKHGAVGDGEEKNGKTWRILHGLIDKCESLGQIISSCKSENMDNKAEKIDE